MGQQDQELHDITKTCVTCNNEFLFEIGEQIFFRDNDFTPPKNCPPCRAKRKAEKMKQGR